MNKTVKVRVAIAGSDGRMGREIQAQIEKSAGLAYAGGADRGGDLNQSLAAAKPQVVIDFSSPEATEAVAQWCAANNVALVTGTTGLNEKQSQAVIAASKKVAVLSSANMSPGIFALSRAIRAFMKSFPGGQVTLEEVHHTQKKDSPSGTAKLLRKVIDENAGSKFEVSETLSVRGGDVFGIHTVKFYAEGEWVTLEHHATGRAVFAKGACLAAAWIAGQKPGLYSMGDVFEGRG